MRAETIGYPFVLRPVAQAAEDRSKTIAQTGPEVESPCQDLLAITTNERGQPLPRASWWKSWRWS